MFYSHEVLTSRKHGVATIWLVATLGSASGHKKITRKAILDVNLPKACQTVTEPETPLALRLQGSLLVGISRVFGQQCEYMKADTESLETRMRKSFKNKNAQQTDAHLTANRSDQLNLPEDPTFNVDMDLGLDFAFFDISTASSRCTHTSGPSRDGTSQSSLQIPADGDQLRFSSSPYQPDNGELPRPDPTHYHPPSVTSKFTSDAVAGITFDEHAVFEDPGMVVNEDGMLVFQDDSIYNVVGAPDGEASGNSVLPVSPSTVLQNGPIQQQSMSAAQLDDGEPQPMTELNDNMPIVQTDPTHTVVDAAPEMQNKSFSPVTEEMTTAEAPQRPTKPSKRARMDFDAELHRKQMAEWGSRYLENMAEAREGKILRASASQAKRDAAFWVLEQGIGGVKVNFGSDGVPHPLAIFSGQSLLELLRGWSPARKRSRSRSGLSDDEHSKRSRIASISLEQGEHGDQAMHWADDEGLFPVQDDLQPESEVGRQADGSLKDHSSQMPWNLSSRQGSSRMYGSALHRVSSIAGSAGGFEMGPLSRLSRHRLRMTTASPLFGKGQPISRDESIDDRNLSPLTYDIDDFGDLDRQLAGDVDEEFELYGPAAQVSTQQADESQWLATTLETEGWNFLEFLNTSIRNQNEADNAETYQGITFDTLLPPTQNSQVVAAQALLHVLTLATKGLINIEQKEDFGNIALSVNASVVA